MSAKSICLCGHSGDGSGSQHGDHVGDQQRAPGHGECQAAGCGCRQFTWASFLHLCEKIDLAGHALTKEHNFGALTDRLGRLLGAHIEVGKVEMREVRGDENAHRPQWQIAPGQYFTLRVQQTRAGRHYGASQSLRFFKTELERERAISRYLAQAERHARKLNAEPKKGGR